MAPPKIKIKDRVWLRGAKGQESFVPASVTNVQQNGARVTVKRSASDPEEVLDTSKADVFPANEDGMKTNDHCALIHLNEPCVLENTRLRYTDGLIYTYTGKILVALNPFGPLPIYGDAVFPKYVDKEVGAKGVDPHLYAMGEAAYKHVKRHKTPAALVMSGESGSGKTETTKHLMRYLAWRSESVSGKNTGKLGKLADAILSTNPVLEAFGNAKTVRNNNSSRFGKMMRLHFEPTGSVSGAVIKTYLLEKSRAVAITNPERNYHVFYQIMAGASADGKGPALSKYKPTDCHMLNQSQCIELVGVKDVDEFKETFGALEKLGVNSTTQTEMMKILSGLLLLGNVTFDQDDSDRADVKNTKDLDAACEVFGLKSITGELTTRKMQRGGARGSQYLIDFNKVQAEGARDAVIKAIYTKIFDWIVIKVNAHISGGDAAAALPYVGLLDIFGFENFTHNSFEQLCINFANEKLQQFFLTCVFKEEEALHLKETVPWANIEFQDNAGCITMLEKPPNGILRLLDSQCKTPNASESTFCKEINRVHAKGDFLVATRKHKMRDEEGFIIAHYAGDVIYHTAEVIGKSTKNQEVPWLEKNNDTLQSEWLAKLCSSTVPFLAELFAEDHAANEKAKKANTFSSVGKRFVNDLNSLLTELQSSKVSFIRCIKPNKEQAPKKFTSSMVLDQLRCSGVIEAVRVMLEAFPTRIDYEDIHGRYAPLMGKEIMDETGDEPAAFCSAIAEACEVAHSDYALGLSKLFLKAGCGTFLEDLAAMDPLVVVPLLTEKIAQAKRKSGAAKLVGNSVLTWWFRKKYKERKKAAELAQHRMRTIKARREYQAWSKARAERLKKEAQEAAEKEAAERAAREAAEKLAKEQAEEMARVAAADQAKKKIEHEAAMKAAKEKAKADAEAKIKSEMAAAVKAAEEAMEVSIARDREKMDVDRSRPGERRLSVAEGASTATRVSQVAEAASYAKNYAEEAGEPEEPVPEDEADESGPSLSKARSDKVVKEELFEVVITRDQQGGTLGIAVDLWDGEVTVGAITTNGPADREGTLIQGDIIRAVEGEPCATIEEVTMCVIKGGISLRLAICRRPVSVVQESEIKMKMPSGEWAPFAFRLLSNRNIEFEKLSPPQYSGEIHARIAQSLDLKDDGVDKVLVIETGHKAFEIKGSSNQELALWHLRLQEVIMLQEKVANVAHGWLLKEEHTVDARGTEKTSLRHFWFVLFSNGILMHFSDPNRANLGQSLGFIPVEECIESSHSSKQHTLHIKCSFDQWLLATNSKENMLQWAASLHAAQPSAAVHKPVVDLILAQGWLDLPREDELQEEVWVRHWFVLKNSELALYSEEQKLKDDLKQSIVVLPTSDMRSAARAKGVDFYKWGIVLETQQGHSIRMRAVGQSEMRQLLSTLNVHCIETTAQDAADDKQFVRSKAIVRSGYLYKKSLKGAGGAVRMGKAWQRRWFVLEVETNEGEDTSQVVKTGKLTYYQSNKDTKEGVEIPLHETMSVRSSLGKTKGTEHRITVTTPKREFELGSDDKGLADAWIADLQCWIGLPKVERLQRDSQAGAATAVKSQWMEARIEVYMPDEISDEELARSNTIQKTVSSFGNIGRTFTLTGRKKDKAPSSQKEGGEGASEKEGDEGDEGEEGEEGDDEAFNWVFVALMSDGTLRQFTNEMMDEELARLKLGYLVQVEFLESPPDTYEHAFRVRPESKTEDSWVLCPDSTNDSEDWIAMIKA
eukprot:CAMPEP_0174733188 /NCGR_PEP_ID=MMETSP1094-20130205/60818_1 /TAXON_ID=156173 /ORGANISM="Chrysochromulina brevifilum, Strain UTEX LB 985" /LENGTH=1727 /DNA_ID=CAMNT_0015935811 /DNA_START=13 /DNA_END=5196 /DNA_ORIENTATION=+